MEKRKHAESLHQMQWVRLSNTTGQIFKKQIESSVLAKFDSFSQ